MLREFGLWFQPKSRSANGAMRCAYCTLRVLLIRWGGVAKRDATPRQQKGRSAPRFFLCPRFISPHACLAWPDCLLTHYQHACFAPPSGRAEKGHLHSYLAASQAWIACLRVSPQ